MKLQLHNYDIFPKVMLVGEPKQITVRPLGRHVAFSGTYTIGILSMTGGSPDRYPNCGNLLEYQVSVNEDGCLRFTHSFPAEDEYLIRICKEELKVVELSVYVLNEDMRGRYPYRGDLHIHTNLSDGTQSPEVVAAHYRQYGHDFLVISDHRRYYPSLEAIDAFRDIPHEMNIVVGEEVHLPGNDVHIVNFGSTYSVNGLLDTSKQSEESDRRAIISDPPPMITEEEYRSQVQALIPQLDIPENVDAFTYASCVWIFEHIRRGGGLGIFAHPYWRVGPYQVPEALCRYMTKTHPFDAFEVLGGELYYEQNGFQTQVYYEDRANGIRYPIVGSTDSHNCLQEHHTLTTIASTFVFARENERTALIHAIKDMYSVAIDTRSAEYRLVGDYRLVKYARFLLDEFTPLHNELCYEEGRLMRAYLAGEPDAAATLRQIHGRTERLFKKYISV